jgi:outer membrane protein OmpA-like peptidoglycan-associated protein
LAQGLYEPKDFNAERFNLSSSRDGLLGVETGAVGHRFDVDLHLWLGTANDPLVIYHTAENGDRNRSGSLIKQRSDGQLGGSVVVMPWLQLTVDASVVLQQSRNDQVTGVAEPLPSLAGFGLGDLRLTAKSRLLRQERSGISLSFVPSFEVPTGLGKEYRGAKGGAVVATLAISQRFTRWSWAADVGYLTRKQTRVGSLAVDDEWQLRMALGVQASKRINVAITASTATAANNVLHNFARNHAELIAGPTININSQWQVVAAGGLGLGAGYGTPDWRALVGFRYSRTVEIAKDLDGDGFIATDKCPTQAEDVDGFEDGDGCADLDNDHDGVPDATDKAPNDAEDRDGFEDDDGAPDLDNDHDGIVDGSDKCPNQAEVVNGVEDSDGCPDASDKDGDGVNDDADKCPSDVEDKDGFEDADGCPDVDNDNDGLTDVKDRCPMVAGPVENYGCPDTDEDTDGVVYRVDVCPNEVGTKEFEGCKKKQKVTLKGGKLVVLEPVFFKTNRAEIQAVSFALLDNVANVLNDHAEFRIQIQGHTDDQGNAAYNKDLSARRAAAVLAYLTGKGVAASRLESAGFGAEQPVMTNKTSKGRAANRRVAFVILSIDGFSIPVK